MSTKIEWTDRTKTCSACAEPKPDDEFAKDSSRPDGLTYWCKACRNDRSRRNHTSRATGAKPGPERFPERDGDQRQARRSVNHLVEIGQMARPNDLPCTDCGHVWSLGERRHEYDHHKGYGTGHHLDVEPVCTTCHHDRETGRVRRPVSARRSTAGSSAAARTASSPNQGAQHHENH